MSSSKTVKSKVKEVTFRNLAFASDFKIKVVDGIVVEALCISMYLLLFHQRKKVKAEDC